MVFHNYSNRYKYATWKKCVNWYIFIPVIRHMQEFDDTRR